MKGYKVFNPNWTCRGFQFEVGKTFTEDVKPECCDRGFHFCTKASDCFNYYGFDPKNKVAEVEAVGDIDTHSDDTKCCTGNHNSGNRNSGNWNSGNWNSGNWNSGDCNSGNRNSCNWNSGNRNSGNWNSGDWNSGNRNSGDCNSGNCNSGNCNSGNWNSGNWNSGDWNKTSNVVGCFNTEHHKLKFFDKESDMSLEQWLGSDARYLLNQIDFRPADWIWSNEMSSDEKSAHPEHETTGGYLEIRDNSDCCVEWWNGLSEKNKSIIRNIPNFDAEKFYQITGIRA